jgi:hypothetical protein
MYQQRVRDIGPRRRDRAGCVDRDADLAGDRRLDEDVGVRFRANATPTVGERPNWAGSSVDSLAMPAYRV